MEASAAGAIFFSDDGKKRVVLLWFWTGQLELGTGRRGTGVRRRPRAGARAERFRRALVLHIRYTSGGLTSSGSGLGASTRAVARAGGRASPGVGSGSVLPSRADGVVAAGAGGARASPASPADTEASCIGSSLTSSFVATGVGAVAGAGAAGADPEVGAS